MECVYSEKKIKEYDIAFLHYLNGEYELLSDKQSEIFVRNIPNIDSKKMTIRNVCQGLGIGVPVEYEMIADEVRKLTYRSKNVKAGDICLIIRSAEDFEAGRMTTRKQYEQAVENGAKVIIMGKEAFYAAGLNEKDYPVILVDNINERILKFFSIFRARQKAKVIMITGSVGKTTTKSLCNTIAKNHFKTFTNSKNFNTVHQTARYMVNNCDKDNDVYIQECGAGYVGSVRFAASILQPDIFILTNVYEHHLQMYKTYENIFADKVSADDYLKKDGIVITNYDDENIRKYQFSHKIITFSIDYEDADYRAINIKQFRDELSFAIREKATGHTVDIKVRMLGKHNVYNILTAFILGRVLDVSEKDIQEDLFEYRTDGIRQNLVNVGGIYINVDCYNVAEESILAMLKAGEEFDLDDGCKRIALIGGENKLGNKVVERSSAFGEKIAGIKMDKVLFCGVKKKTEASLNKYGDAVSIKKSFDRCSNVPSGLSTKIKHMVKFLNKNVSCGDLVMIKGIYWLNMAVAIDKAFGTSFSFDFSAYKDITTKIKDRGYVASLIEVFEEVEILEAPVNNGKLIIPKKIKHYPVFRIKSAAFKGNDDIVNIDFGKSIKNIGESSFSRCKCIKEIQIPSNVKVIENEAFSQCSSLVSVILSEGVTHISINAFAKCENLKEVYIPSSVRMIEKNAFKGCPDVVIYCIENSFAYKYAQENDIEFKLRGSGKYV